MNELGWWSKWAELRRHGDGYLLRSKVLKEQFFNRAGSLSCQGITSTASWAEPLFARAGAPPTMLVYDSCEEVESLLASGYRQSDTMTTLFSKGPTGRRGDGNPVVSTDPGRWADGYLRSFYGTTELAEALSRIASSLLRVRSSTLMESRVGGDTAGVLALFRTPGVIGAYCVGTVPEYRGRGVATGLLEKAKEVADSEGNALVLQTLASDGVLGFYVARGFEVMYTKRMLEKKRLK
ncbi:MAG: GNAT family N-acetyltransferase [Nitrososphaerota archaeon]|nr:GNAT family N-acetyltransferase [Nitrososphaerota archaeon]